MLDEKLDAVNDALVKVGDDTRASLLAKLDAKRGRRGRGNRVTDAEERRWNLPHVKWEHWEVPFDADPDWPDALRERLEVTTARRGEKRWTRSTPASRLTPSRRY